MFYGEIRIKQGISYISFCPLRILYNSKFIIMATFLGTNVVVVTRVHCILFPQKIDFDSPCKLSPKETICIECQNASLFSLKNKKGIINMSSADYILSSTSVFTLLSFRHHSPGKMVFAWSFISNENILFWFTISYQELFVISVSAFCFQIFTLKLNLRPKFGLTYTISIGIFCLRFFLTFLCWI